MEEPTFTARTNRFGQYVSAEQQAQRYHQVLAEMEALYGPGETYEIECFDYHLEGRGRNQRAVKVITGKEIVNRSERAKWYAEHGY